MLKLLKKASAKVRKKILKNSNKTLLCCICECAQNVLKGKVPVKTSEEQIEPVQEEAKTFSVEENTS